MDAPFTTGQPESYRQEVDERRKAGHTVGAVLVCPGRRKALLEAEAAGCFDAIVTCEELAEQARRAGGAWGRAAEMVLLGAAEPRPGP